MPVPDFSPGEVLTAAAMDSIGLWLVKTVTVGSNVASVPVTDCFSANYDNYRIVISGIDSASASSELRFQLNNQTTAIYNWSYSLGTFGGNAIANAGANSQNTWLVGLSGDNDDTFASVEVSNPFVSNRRTVFTSLGTASPFRFWSGAIATATASNTGFTLSCGSNMTGGTIRVYGYRN
jgi:hypothetical protein